MNRFSLIVLILGVLLVVAELKTIQAEETVSAQAEAERRKGKKKVHALPLAAKKDCDTFKDKVKKAEAEAIALRKKFHVECLRKAKEEQKEAEEDICRIAIKKAQAKAKLKAVEDSLKLASKTEEGKLLPKMSKLEKLIKMVKKDKKKARLRAAKADRVLEKLRRKRASQLERKKEDLLKKLKKENDKLIKNQATVKKLIKDVEGEGSRVLKNKLQRTIARLQRKIATRTENQKIVQDKLAKINAKLKSQQTKLQHIADKRKKEKEHNKCKTLHKKLEKELQKALKLKAQFEKECSKALKTAKNEAIIKAIDLKKEIEKAKKKIELIKIKITKVAKNQHPTLLKEIDDLEQKIKLYEEKLVIATKTVADYDNQIKITKDQQEKFELQEKRKNTIDKCDKLRKQLELEKKKHVLLKEKARKECQKKIRKAKKSFKGKIVVLKQKLKLAKEEYDEIKIENDSKKKLFEMRVKAERLTEKSLSATEQKLKDRADKKRMKLMEQMKALTEQQLVAAQRAKEIQQQIEAKSQAELINERNAENKVQDKLNKDLDGLNKKTVSLTAAIKKANDEFVKAELNKAQTENNQKILALKKDISAEAKKIKNLELEIAVKGKVEAESVKLSKLLDMLKIKLKKTENDIAAEYKATKRTNEEKNSKKKKEVEAVNQLIKAANEKLTAAQKKAKLMAQQYGGELKAAKDQVSTFRTQLSQETKNLYKMKAEYEDYQLRMEREIKIGVEGESARGDAKVKELNSQLDTCKAQLASLQDQVDRVNIEINQKQAIVDATDAADTKIKALEATMKTVKAQFNKNLKSSIELDIKINNTCRKTTLSADAAAQCKIMQSDYANLTNDITKAKNDIQDAEAKITIKLSEFPQ